MTEMIDDRIRLLIKVSRMYYVDGLNQVEISKRLRKSRSQISRLLTAARSEGIVQISIRDPFTQEHQYEKALLEKFHLRDVIVTPASKNKSLGDYDLVQSAANWFTSIVQDHDVVGVMAGRTITAMGQAIQPISRQNVQFVPLIGGWGAEGIDWDANSNTRNFAEKIKAKYWQLHAPAIVNSSKSQEILLKEEDIAEVLALARKSTIALIGIGQVSEQATIVKAGYMDNQDIKEVRGKGAVANICTSFLDKDGNHMEEVYESRMIGLSVTELRKIPYVVAVASGVDKVSAILSVLRKQWIDVLIIDKHTAKAVLNHNNPKG